jgi:hypothetical protein
MKNQDLSLFKKGNYQPINNDFITEGHEVLQEVKMIQEKFNKADTDTFINELRDSIVGYELGMELVNTNKHGFDCKKSVGGDIWLEVKSASFSSSSWSATFNDTNIEKAKAFQDEKLFLALAVWNGASDLLFICFGQNENLGYWLEEKVNNFYNGNGVRSTQTISISDLINKYGFKVLAVNKTKQDVYEILRYKSRALKNISRDIIYDSSNFNGL